jgi:uncharacterized membrane-anchored protein YhcB (DUF1043 family)
MEINLNNIKELYAKYKYYLLFLIIGIIIGILFLPTKIVEKRSSEDIKTIESLKSEVKSATSKYMVLKNNFKEHCITTVEVSGKKVIDCKRESETNQNTQSQSQEHLLVNSNTSNSVHNQSSVIEKPYNQSGIGPTVILGRNKIMVGGMASFTIWKFEPVFSVLYDVKNPDLLGQVGLIIH